MIERSRAGCRFFQRLTHRFGADRIDQAQYDHLVSEQLQGPVTSPTGWVGAGQLHQLLLHVSFDLELLWTCRLRSVVDRCLQSFDDKSFPDPSDGFQAGTQSGDDFIVGVSFPAHTIRQQQNAGMGQLTTGRLPVETSCSKAARSSGTSVTRYFSIAVLLHLMNILKRMPARNRSSRHPSIRD